MARELWKTRISIDPEIHHGDPCIRGTRVPVAIIVGSLAEGMMPEDVLKEYPQLSREDILAALEYAGRTIHGERASSPSAGSPFLRQKTERRKRFRAMAGWLFAGAFLCSAAVLLMKLLQTRKEMREAMIAIKQERLVDELVANLRVPSEALYYPDWSDVQQIAEARKRNYERHGTTTFIPYWALQQEGLVEAGTAWPTNDPSQIINGSFENYWLNQPRDAWLNLALQLEENRGVGAYLNSHPAIFARRVRPLLLRLTEAYHPWPRLDACHALLAAGDRSQKVKDALAPFLREPKWASVVTTDKDGKRVERLQYSAEKVRAMVLNEKYALGLDSSPADDKPEPKTKEGSR
ncbi:MAG: DUF433 domain-containing protein [Planctomycetes bacterium]|nr:DUF433 domain-containing protein [Planctomycetota bacterium]